MMLLTCSSKSRVLCKVYMRAKVPQFWFIEYARRNVNGLFAGLKEYPGLMKAQHHIEKTI